jgi:hypothetical protein
MAVSDSNRAVAAGKRGPLWRRLTLRRGDGRVYLDRWGIVHDRVGGVLIHRMQASDPGVDLHDHPFTFLTIPIVGSYIEQRGDTRDACDRARNAERVASFDLPRGRVEERKRFRPKMLRLDECHRITHVFHGCCWTIVFRGPLRRGWGFYLPEGYMPEAEYFATVRAERRDLWAEPRGRS